MAEIDVFTDGSGHTVLCQVLGCNNCKGKITWSCPLSVIINSIEYPFGVSLGQFCPGIIIYQQNPNISIKYLDQSENYIQKIVPIDLTTYIYANVSADYDLPLNTAFSTETSENYKERMQSRLVFLRDKK